MRVLWLIDSLNAGGAEALVPRFLRAAAPLEVEVAWLKEIGGNPLEAELRAEHVALHPIGARHLRDVAALRRLVRLVRERRFDVVHAHLTYASIFAALAGRLTGIPVVATLHVLPHGSTSTLADRVRQRLMCGLLRGAGCAVVAVSAAVRDAYVAAGLLRAEHVRVVANGIDVERWAAAAPSAERGNLPVDARVATCVCVLRAGKGVEVLLEALARAAQADPRLRAWIVGDGPLRGPLEARAAALGLNGVVRWMGFRRDVPELLRASDVVVVPSLVDALPTVVMEAMAAGCPVVASQTGGIPELVGDAGVLVPPGDAAALAGALLDLLEHPADRAALGAAATRRARERFGAAAWVEQLCALYASVATPGVAWVGAPGSSAMRVAVVETAGKGGLAHYAFQLARGLSEIGVETTLLTAEPWELAHRPHSFAVHPLLRLWDPKPVREPGPLRRRVRRAARAVRYYREWGRLGRHLVRERYDLVLFGDIRFPSDGLVLALLRMLGVRLADVCHNVFPFGSTSGSVRRGALLRAAYRQVYRQFELVFVHFEVNRREFQQAYGLPPERVVVIPHGNEDLFREERDAAATPAGVRARLKLAADAQVVLLLGTLSSYKGAEVAISAMPLVRREAPRAHLVLAGYPAPDFDVDAHRRQAVALGVGDAVTVVPAYVPTPEVAAWMELASVAVFPYHAVFQSGALQVALTFGVPIVATSVGAMAEVVDDGRNGVLVGPGDEKELAAAVAGLLREPERAARLGAAAAQDARTRFGWSAIARTVADAAHARPAEAAGTAA